MIPGHYVWLTWSSAFLVPWLGLFLGFRRYRKIMIWTSVATMPFGLTEPLFVPRYWNPPSLFDLAQRTGFDIESLMFCFAIGGVGVVLYDIVTSATLVPVGRTERACRRHRFHRAALLAPVAAFPILMLLPWNPIYPAIIAMALGGVATALCRPDLASKSLIGGALFAAYYATFMLLLAWSSPGYIERVWNLAALSGFRIGDIPAEELLFGFAFGTYWSGIFEHLTWRSLVRADVAALRA
ncbi:MAG TPA: lycopene cyclase domain-containing protein [Stellaceae bacterium]|nr:lycopene cyclase domain-containing protein [Stellaceae bacterium]